MGQEWHFVYRRKCRTPQTKRCSEIQGRKWPFSGSFRVCDCLFTFFYIVAGLLCGTVCAFAMWCMQYVQTCVTNFLSRHIFSMKHAQCRARGNNIVWDYLFDVFLESDKRKVSATQCDSNWFPFVSSCWLYIDGCSWFHGVLEFDSQNSSKRNQPCSAFASKHMKNIAV